MQLVLHIITSRWGRGSGRSVEWEWRAVYKNNSKMLRPLTELTEYPAWSNIYLSHIFHESSKVLALENGKTFHLALPTVQLSEKTADKTNTYSFGIYLCLY